MIIERVWIPEHWKIIRCSTGEIKEKIWIKGYWKTVNSFTKRWRW